MSSKHKSKISPSALPSTSPIGEKRVLITAALPFVNNVPHLGTLLPIISADCYARFCRLTGKDVLFVCGTDEHGTTTEVKALEEGLTPKQICDKYFHLQKEIYAWFGCSFDCFGGTSSKENKAVTLDIFRRLETNGYISEQTLRQLYCTVCRRFLADRYVGGECPHCGYGEARGDQCEQCGKLLEPVELKHPVCRICKKSTPVIKDTKHLFLDLPKLEAPLLAWMATVRRRWTANAQTMTNAWLLEGLRPRCITRDLSWGIPVPTPGLEGKVFYSWFDAPIGYIGIASEHRKDWREWWQNPASVRLVQFMGKDNIPFHTILFPSYLIGTNQSWTLVSDLSVNEFLNLEGGLQFSKSRGVGVFGDNAQESGIPPDVWRYHLIINRPEKSDTEFSWKDLQSKINDELVANLGNLINRVMTFTHTRYANVVGKISPTPKDEEFKAAVKSRQENVRLLLDDIRLKDALKEVMHISKISNHYLQESQPWKTISTHPLQASTCLGILLNVAKDLSILVSPFMPHISKRIQHQLNICDMELSWKHLGTHLIKEGHRINDPEPLFTKIDDATISSLSTRFGFSRQESFPLNLRVARIQTIQPHPHADKLYILHIDVGPLGSRQLVAGLRGHYTPQELQGRHIIIVSNLQSATLRGVESQGMLLAGERHGRVRILEAPASKPGELATFTGQEAQDGPLTYEEFSRVHLEIINKQCVQEHTGLPLQTPTENITCDVEDHAKVK